MKEKTENSIRCATCPMMRIFGRGRYTGSSAFPMPRGTCYCGHMEGDAARKLICPRSYRAFGFVAFTKGASNEPDIKTAPRWCPRKMASKPREISREDADGIIERRHPYGLFFLKEGDVYVGIDNSDGNAWTEDFPVKRKCLEWLMGEAHEE